MPEVPRGMAQLVRRCALHMAIWNDHVQTVLALLRLYGDQAETPEEGSLEWPPLHVAVLHGSTATVVALVEARADVDAEFSGDTPLSAAVIAEHIGTVSALLALKAGVDRTCATSAWPDAAATCSAVCPCAQSHP